MKESKHYAVFQLDTYGSIISWNQGAQDIKGYSSAEIIGQSFRIFYTPEDLALGVPETLLAQAKQRGASRAEGWRVRKDGSRFWGNVTITALHNEQGVLIGFTKVTSDATSSYLDQQMQHESLIQLVNKRIDLERFSIAAAHDLMSPIDTISSIMSYLKTEFLNISQQDKIFYFDSVQNLSAQIRSMISVVTNYIRLDQVGTLEDCDCQKLVSSVADSLEMLNPAMHMQSQLHDLPIVKGYKTLLYQLFQNLLSNAVKYKSPTTDLHIQISASETKDLWQFQVADNGIGIESAELKDIFNLFHRSSHHKDIQGDGIGLASCRKIVSIHNGDIWAESSVGLGTVIYFTISKSILSTRGNNP